MTQHCYECEYAYWSDDGNYYCDCIEDGDYGDCPMQEEERE